MNHEISIKIQAAHLVKAEADAFYKACGSAGIVNASDTLVSAYSGQEMIGNVRLCLENECFVLRTMRVKDSFQRMNIGSKILLQFSKLLSDRNIKTIYCIPYTHLEFFYGQIGFKKIDSEEAPIFLQDRIQKMSFDHPQNRYILMCKKS